MKALCLSFFEENLLVIIIANLCYVYALYPVNMICKLH